MVKKKKTIKYYEVNFRWTSVEPDNAQYKPFKPLFTPDNVFVTIQVPAEYVLEHEEGEDRYVRLSIEGLQYCREQLLGRDGPQAADNSAEWQETQAELADEFGSSDDEDW